jgi:hypothetical protein
MYKIISIEKEYPPVGEFVTTIDEAGKHRVYKMNKDKTWTMRDYDGVDSPPNNLKIAQWLKKCDRGDFIEIAFKYKEIEALKKKKQDLYGLRENVKEILNGHVEIPEEEIFKLFNQLEKLSKYLDANIDKIHGSVGL